MEDIDKQEERLNSEAMVTVQDCIELAVRDLVLESGSNSNTPIIRAFKQEFDEQERAQLDAPLKLSDLKLWVQKLGHIEDLVHTLCFVNGFPLTAARWHKNLPVD